MEVKLENISKRFGYQWILKDFSHDFITSSITGISGPNGSGKSTIIKIMASYLGPTSGKITYYAHNREISYDRVFRKISLVAPYTSLIREFTLKEQFAYHFQFKPMLEETSYQAFREFLDLEVSENKRIAEFSSGMHQRLQLALALLSDTSLLLLDEPTSYLDASAKEWFEGHLTDCKKNRTVIIASNDPQDFNTCHSILDIRKAR